MRVETARGDGCFVATEDVHQLVGYGTVHTDSTAGAHKHPPESLRDGGRAERERKEENIGK